jgi:hypothetical protein
MLVLHDTLKVRLKVHLKVRLNDDMHALHVKFVPLTVLYYNAVYKSRIFSIIPTVKLILPRCGLNTIFSTYKSKVFLLMEFFGMWPR